MNQRRPAGRAYPGTQAVLRAVALLKAFTPERPARGLAELSRAVGLNKTTVYRLLSALESEALVERAPSGDGYRLGPEVLTLGARARGAGDLRAASRTELETLAFETRETASVEVLVGAETLILDEAIGSHVFGTLPSLGTRWPAHTTSTGKVLLAHLPEPALSTLLRLPLPTPTARTIADPAALRRELARVRERGYAISSEELELGFVAVGAPVRDAGGSVVAALSIGGPKSRLSPARLSDIAQRLPAAAGRVSQRLGFSDPQPRAAAAPAPRKGRT